ncbi:MAG: hypothetical protein K2G41_00730 [Duncaniella sp.]|uniref:Cbp1 family collagen-binding glycoprotein adhesin n=1 Tax=Duncaniella sp. TaxID=2518496 RepID=UPI0019AD42CB|nr:hypothetical protein [Duncaniella sp.]MBD5313630.1 hypothetical protein [Bacteroides sp.]MBD5334679.1 hypothetical protein [Bacteroides sp.]MDE6089202.1 hypothetical protein [Duncaniella sp.]
MKKNAIFAVIAAAILTACNGGKLRDAEAQNEQLKGDLRETLATQDSLLVLVNDISDGMAQIKDLEKIISLPGNLGESTSRKEQIKNDMIAIQQALQERRQRLEELEKKLAQTGGESTTLKRTIANLKGQIAEQQTEIATLTNQLASANIRIEELTSEVSSLNTAKDSLATDLNEERAQKEAAELAATEATNELNTVYFAIGTGKELKSKKILESGFLRKTKVMKGDFDMNYFTAADRRTLTQIPTHSKKANIKTSQPKDSYEIVEQDGQKVIRITNPEKFWQLSNFLVIEVD